MSQPEARSRHLGSARPAQAGKADQSGENRYYNWIFSSLPVIRLREWACGCRPGGFLLKRRQPAMCKIFRLSFISILTPNTTARATHRKRCERPPGGGGSGRTKMVRHADVPGYFRQPAGRAIILINLYDMIFSHIISVKIKDPENYRVFERFFSCHRCCRPDVHRCARHRDNRQRHTC